MNLYESIKVNKIDKKKIIKNEAIPANNQYNVEAENDNEKKLDIVEKLANDFVEYLRKNEIFAELDDYSIAENQRTNDVYGVIDYSIEWGDWKHDHLYSEDLAKEFFKEDLSISEDVTEEDGSDTYSATHEFSFNLAPYLGKEIKESDEEPIECEIQFDEDGRAYFIYNNEKEYLDEYMKDNTGGAIKTLTAFSAIRIVPSDNGETVLVQYLHESEDELEESAEDKVSEEDTLYKYEFSPLDFPVKFIDLDEKVEGLNIHYPKLKFKVDKNRYGNDVIVVIGDKEDIYRYMLANGWFKNDKKLFLQGLDKVNEDELNESTEDNKLNESDEDKVSEEDINELLTFFDKDDETIKRDFNRWTAVRTMMDNIGDKEFPQLDFMIKYNLTPEEKQNLASKICDKIEKELNESDRQVATVKDIDKIINMSNKELDDFDRSHSYENSDLAEYVRCRLLYAETGLAKHKECYEKALNSLKDNKLNESSTEERWNATELDREGFYALLKFNNSEEHLNPSLKYIITRDGNEVYRFAMQGNNERIKDAGAKIEFRNFLKSKNNEEIEEAEEIKEDDDKNARFVKSTLNKVALDKISNAIVNIEDAVSLINDNDEAKNKIKSIVEELENYLGLDDYGRPKA